MNFLYRTLLVLVLVVSICNAADPLGDFCNEASTKFSKKSQISINIDNLLAELVSKTIASGYTATFKGNGKDKIYGLAQCRGDVGTKECSSCLTDAAKQIRDRCPSQADARIWYDFCFLRYSQEDFFGKIDTGYGIFYWNVENVTDPDGFNEKLGALIDKIRSQAVVDKNQGLGKDQTKLSTFITLYALVQCTRDLAAIDCAQCLAIAVSNFPTYCSNRKGCRVLYSSCYLRYELYPFFFPLDQPMNSLLGNSVAIVHP